MRKMVILFLTTAVFSCCIMGAISRVSYAGEVKEDSRTEDKGVKGVMEKAWIKIRMLSPRKKAKGAASAVAGIKGAERGSEELTPYWKGQEKPREEEELKRFTDAEKFLEDGKCSEAVVAFGSFYEEFPVSRLAPNALFSKGLCLVKLEQSREAVAIFGEFLNDYPDHELAGDAKEIVAAIGEGGE